MEYNIERIIKNQKIFDFNKLKESNISIDDVKYNVKFGIEFNTVVGNIDCVNIIMDKIIYDVGDTLDNTCSYNIPYNKDYETTSFIRYIRILMMCSSPEDAETLYKKILSFKIKN